MRFGGEHRSAQRIESPTAALIDVVFLLLIFFMLTLKITPPEGELDLAVPASAAANESPDPLLPPLRVELTADAGGGLASLTLDGADLGGGPDALERLHESVVDTVVLADGSVSDEAAVTLDVDERLNYEFFVDAMAAVRSRRDPAGKVVPMVETVRLTPRG